MRRLLAVLLFLATGLAAGLALDAWLQVAEIQCPLETYIDPAYGPAYYPDREFSRFNESFFLGGTNRWGYLGEGRPPRNESGELRILLVGDSFVLGHTVFERHHFKRVMERDLTAALGRPVAVLNFARADFNLWNMHRYYRDFASRWDHDLALLFLGEPDLVPGRQVGSSLYPFSYAAGDTVAADYSFRASGLYRQAKILEPVVSRLAVPRLAFNLYKVGLRGELPRVLFGKFAPARRAATEEEGAALVREQSPPLPVNSRVLLRDLAADPRVLLVYKEPIAEAYRAAIDSLGADPADLELVFAAMRARGVDPRWWPVTHRHGHWNHAAHVEIGHALASEILGRRRLAVGAAP
ncbi:MAG TPA: hypothetical protein PLL30_08945 [Candidatus Krumholzibacteria bacterium]|nr:hypothetical protein [Candidatus Krumholzibacteria bacterium]HPD71886.1 hypothetical protein [Candidatus Krumholzibacteria bacterium]HRY41181.1 hypothetical protein [Candidatus Krumholzibacteria bacterium]